MAFTAKPPAQDRVGNVRSFSGQGVQNGIGIVYTVEIIIPGADDKGRSGQVGRKIVDPLPVPVAIGAGIDIVGSHFSHPEHFIRVSPQLVVNTGHRLCKIIIVTEEVGGDDTGRRQLVQLLAAPGQQSQTQAS